MSPGLLCKNQITFQFGTPTVVCYKQLLAVNNVRKKSNQKNQVDLSLAILTFKSV